MGSALASLTWRWLALTLRTWWDHSFSHPCHPRSHPIIRTWPHKLPPQIFSCFYAVFFSLIWMSQIHKLHFDLHSLELESKNLIHIETVKVHEKGWEWAGLYLNWTKSRAIYFFSWKESELLRIKEVTKNEEKVFWLLVTMKIFMVRKHLWICMLVLWKPRIHGTL